MKSSKKEIIVEAATRLFAEKGFKETPMNEICKLVRVAEGTIFYHFKTKEDIYLAVLENVKKGIVEEFDIYIRQNSFENGLEMVEGLLSFYLNLAATKIQWFMLLQHHYPYELAKVNPVCRQYLEAVYNCLIDIFEKAIQTGQNDGSVGNVPARKAAFIIFSMGNGLVWFKINGLYNAAVLYDELMASCRKILSPKEVQVS